MKTSIIASMLVFSLAYQSLGQLNLKTDFSPSVYNYKQANTAAYLKKHSLHNQARIGQSVVIQAENYKHANSYLMSRKAVVVKGATNKSYRSYKHQHRVKD
jgi:hypothetical protein